MAKTATKVSSIDAQKVIDDLEAKKSALALARANDESGMAAIAYEAHTGDQKAEAKLETLRERALRRDLEMRNLESALTEAKRRLVAAQEAERQAEEARVAGELAELAQMMREAGAKCDRALKLLAESSNELRKIVQATNQRGLGNPSAQQLQSLGSRAILAMIINSPYAKDFPHIAPRERQDFSQFTGAWSAMIEKAIAAKLDKDAA